jgi:hypothetical protein
MTKKVCLDATNRNLKKQAQGQMKQELGASSNQEMQAGQSRETPQPETLRGQS